MEKYTWDDVIINPNSEQAKSCIGKEVYCADSPHYCLEKANGNDVDDTSPTYKVLEEGSATQTKEELIQLASRQQKFIQGLEAALIRIENKTYGIDRITGKLIPKERLRAVPHATLSVESKQNRKK